MSSTNITRFRKHRTRVQDREKRRATSHHGDRSGNWYNHSLIDNDLLTSVGADASMAEAMNTFVGAQI